MTLSHQLGYDPGYDPRSPTATRSLPLETSPENYQVSTTAEGKLVTVVSVLVYDPKSPTRL